jgi:hypothetical protein
MVSLKEFGGEACPAEIGGRRGSGEWDKELVERGRLGRSHLYLGGGGHEGKEE